MDLDFWDYQKSRSILLDRSRFLGLFWQEKTWSYNRRDMVVCLLPPLCMCYNNKLLNVVNLFVHSAV